MSNIAFYDNCYYKLKINNVTHKVFEGYLSYKPTHCYKCGVAFDYNFEKHGFIISNIKIPEVPGFKSILKLHKQSVSIVIFIIDMYSPYVSLIKTMFSNARIVIDSFHLVQLISRSLNKTKISAMKNNKSCYNKMKRYWKLILKSRNDLDCSVWKRFVCFTNLMTEKDVVDYIINQDKELKETYFKYQGLLSSIKDKSKEKFLKEITEINEMVSDYMKTSIKTLDNYKDNILNTFKTNYHNGFIEGNNNFIKVLKRIAFGFRSFRRFKARVMICKGLIKLNRKKANACALAL